MQEEGENIKRGTGTNRDTDLPLRNWPCDLVVVPVSHYPGSENQKRVYDPILWQQPIINIWTPLNRTTGRS